MDDAVLKDAMRRVLSSSLVSDSVEFLWHAGEPLTVGQDFYVRALRYQRAYRPAGLEIHNVIQTNAILIDERWCRFFLEAEFTVGVSIDGPREVHDQTRVFWNGRGSFSRTMDGIKRLQDHGIRLGALCVVTKQHLSHAAEIYRFFRQNCFSSVGFNIEENEGSHSTSSLNQESGLAYSGFFQTLYDLWMEDGRPFRIREFDDFHNLIFDVRDNPSFARQPDETRPLSIVTISREGDFSTFSPELATMRSARYGHFHLGNVASDPIEWDALERRPDIVRDIAAGILNCRTSCPIFAFCGGSYLSNRIAEHDSFLPPETNACRLHRQILLRTVLDSLRYHSRKFKNAVPFSDERS